MPQMAETDDRKVYADLRPASIPNGMLQRVRKFFLDGATGNITLNVRDGQILGLKIEELHSVRAAKQTR